MVMEVMLRSSWALDDSSFMALGPRASWLDAQAIRSRGAVYTPSGLAAYVAGRLLDFSVESGPAENGLGRLLVLDPACGDGELLVAIRNEALARGVPTSLVGMDIDSEALKVASSRLGDCDAVGLFSGNSLLPWGSTSPEKGWGRRLKSVGHAGKVDLLIANPPWGADLSEYRGRLAAAGYQLARGQYDSYDLFVELATEVVRPGGHFAFIIPDSLFATEHRSLREFLLSRTQLMLVARLGEGLFDSVFRGCVVVIGRNTVPSGNGVTRCVRWTGPWRQKVMRGEVGFEDAERALFHDVDTDRFMQSPEATIDIDVTEGDIATLKKLRSSKATVAEYLDSARGVEISKHGRVVHCRSCGTWSPRPKTLESCPACGQSDVALDEDTIVSATARDGYAPFIVGEDVERHAIRSHRWLATGRQGINYKDASLYVGPKLLVRKTGVGISAAMDYSNAYTNQVVYVFKKHADLPEWVPIEFAAALICSRVAYYHLVKTHGETEWRSHPYVTQKHILDLPAPSKQQIELFREEIVAVAQALSPRNGSKGVTKESDIQLEQVIARCFGLVRADYDRIYETLNELQELLPVRALKNISVDDIF